MEGVHCLRNLQVLDDECINRIKKHQARPPTAAGSAAANQSRPHKPPHPLCPCRTPSASPFICSVLLASPRVSSLQVVGTPVPSKVFEKAGENVMKILIEEQFPKFTATYPPPWSRTTAITRHTK